MEPKIREKTCSFFGHRDIEETLALYENIRNTVIYLIEQKGVKRFLFGSKSRFDTLCWKVVTKIKERYSEIRRVYVRSMYPTLSDFYEKYLLESCEETVYPPRVENAGRASYIQRNQAMINESDYCIFYCNPDYVPPVKKSKNRFLPDVTRRSGTKLALEYAYQRQKRGELTEIINLYKGENGW